MPCYHYRISDVAKITALNKKDFSLGLFLSAFVSWIANAILAEVQTFSSVFLARSVVTKTLEGVV